MPGHEVGSPNRFMSLLGLVSSGDLGDITCYKSQRGKVVFFSKTWPKKNPTLAQITGRARMSFCAEQWRGFPPHYKWAWDRVTKALSLCMTGYNLWQRWWHGGNLWDLRYYAGQTGINLMDKIWTTIPALPANWRVEPFVILNPPTKGVVRYSRDYAWLRPNSRTWINFLPYHAQLENSLPIRSIFTVYGWGTVQASPMLNARWNRVAFDSWIMPHTSEVEVKCWFPDGTFDSTYTVVRCSDMLL